MKKLKKHFSSIIYIIFILLLIEFGYRFMMGQMNIEMPDLADQKPEKLYPLLPVAPREAGEKLTDKVIYTFKATDTDNWAFFDFSRGSVVSDVKSPREAKGWDLGFSRAKIAANWGGINEKGQVLVSRLETTDFDSVTRVPEKAKFTKGIKPSLGADTRHSSLKQWYKYSFWDHHLKSHKYVYIIKTNEGNYAKMQIINFYCEKKEERMNSCYTIQYVYQGNGSKSFVKDVNVPKSL